MVGLKDVEFTKGTVAAIGAMIIMVIVTLVVVSTVITSNLVGDDQTTSYSITNETGRVNQTAYTLSRANASNSAYVITSIFNNTAGVTPSVYNVSIGTGNASVTTAGIMTSATPASWNFTDVKFSYTFVYTYNNMYQDTNELMGSNFSSGLNNVSSKIPTIMLITVIILLLGVLAILIMRMRTMMGGEGGSL